MSLKIMNVCLFSRLRDCPESKICIFLATRHSLYSHSEEPRSPSRTGMTTIGGKYHTTWKDHAKSHLQIFQFRKVRQWVRYLSIKIIVIEFSERAKQIIASLCWRYFESVCFLWLFLNNIMNPNRIRKGSNWNLNHSSTVIIIIKIKSTSC